MCALSFESDGCAMPAERGTREGGKVCIHCHVKKKLSEMSTYYVGKKSEGRSGISSVCILCRSEQAYDCKQRKKHLEVDNLIRGWKR